MKSKKIVAAVIIGGIILTLTWAGWQIFKPKTQDSFTQKEISIKQAEIPDVDSLTYDDWSGFSFSYPSIVAVKEVELDNPQVYSSLELSGSDGQRLTVKVADTQIASLIDWQKIFNQQNSVRKIDQTTLVGLPALRLSYGAPEMLVTVAIDNGILYQIENQSDDGFWNRTHDDLVTSFKFTAAEINTAGSSFTKETITLVEETVE